MTAKTHGYITKEIELEQIYQFILKWFDPSAKVNRYENKNGENNEMAVYFTYKGEERRLFAIVYKSTKFSKTGQKERQILQNICRISVRKRRSIFEKSQKITSCWLFSEESCQK